MLHPVVKKPLSTRVDESGPTPSKIQLTDIAESKGPKSVMLPPHVAFSIETIEAINVKQRELMKVIANPKPYSATERAQLQDLAKLYQDCKSTVAAEKFAEKLILMASMIQIPTGSKAHQYATTLKYFTAAEIIAPSRLLRPDEAATKTQLQAGLQKAENFARSGHGALSAPRGAPESDSRVSLGKDVQSQSSETGKMHYSK